MERLCIKYPIDGNIHAEDTSNSGDFHVLRTDIVLSDDDLSEEAKAQFSYHTEILNAFQLNARNILANNRISPIGRHLICTTLEQDYMNCKRVLNYVATHPEVKMKSKYLIPPPLVLCGMPRSGSTLLYNLLACDPASRSPLLADMVVPIPPLARSDIIGQMQRNIFLDSSNDALKALGLADCKQQYSAYHALYEHEEDEFILYQVGVVPLHLMLVPDDNMELGTWFFDDTNKDFVYEYHKTFLQMLNSVDAPRSHWLWKTPPHAYFLETFLRHYPSASIIMTHRRLDEVLPSAALLGTASASPYFDSTSVDAKVDKHSVVKHFLGALDVRIKRIVKFRSDHPHIPVFDVIYDDLLAQPIDTVRRIYEHFGLAWSEDFERSMLQWLRENPRGKQGRNTYTIDEFGLTHDKN
jgi:hypothetical protein